MFDEVLALCMESDINIQNINYQLLQENYSLLLEGEDSSANEKKILTKLKDTITEFFTKILNAMKRTATKILTLSNRLNSIGMASVVDNKMEDVLVPQHDLSAIMTWAKNIIDGIDKSYGTFAEYESFEEYGKRNGLTEMTPSKYGQEKSILDMYKTAIDFVKKQRSTILNKFKWDYSKTYGNSENGQKVIKAIFKVQKEAISEIQKRVNYSIKFITTAIRRSYNVSGYKKLT